LGGRGEGKTAIAQVLLMMCAIRYVDQSWPGAVLSDVAAEDMWSTLLSEVDSLRRLCAQAFMFQPLALFARQPSLEAQPCKGSQAMCDLLECTTAVV
jgi:hypothetical protein